MNTGNSVMKALGGGGVGRCRVERVNGGEKEISIIFSIIKILYKRSLSLAHHLFYPPNFLITYLNILPGSNIFPRLHCASWRRIPVPLSSVEVKGPEPDHLSQSQHREWAGSLLGP